MEQLLPRHRHGPNSVNAFSIDGNFQSNNQEFLIFSIFPELRYYGTGMIPDFLLLVSLGTLGGLGGLESLGGLGGLGSLGGLGGLSGRGKRRGSGDSGAAG